MKTLCLTLLLLTLAPTHARASDAEEGESRVEIKNYKDPELRSYAQMLKGMTAYRDKHAYAPHSKLYFLLIPKSRHVAVQNVTMRLASDEESIPIPLDATGKFELPFIEMKRDDEYDLILNRPKGEFLIRPYVASEGLAPDTERLGDLRLECEVRWAIEKQDVSPVFRAYVGMFSSGNPCTSRFVKVGFYAPEGVETVTLESSQSPITEKVRPYETYSLPIWNKELGDDALVRFSRKPYP